MLNEEQESSQSNSSNGSGALQQHSSGGGFQLKSSILRQPATFGSGAGAGGGFGGIFGGSSASGASSGPINSFNLKPSVLKPSHFGAGGFGGGFGGEKKAAAADDQSQTNSNSFGVNPFLKTQASEDDGSNSKKEDDSAAEKEENGGGDPLAKLNRATLPKSNLFANVKAITQNTGFVFGQNVHERVTGDNLQSQDSGAVPTAGLSFSSAGATTNSNDSSSSNPGAAGGQSGAAAAAAGASGTTAAGASGANKAEGGDESLEEAARRYEESRGALKRKFDEVETVTGEEDERNVVEANCKLFAFAKSNWEERGHGTVRLNDNDSKESRVVFRQAGNLRVLINTKVWSGMTAEQSSPKSLRLTAMDNNGQVKVFLLMTRPEVIGKLHKELSKRIQVAKENATAEEEDSLLQDDEAGKENNNDNSATSTKPSDCEDDPTVPESATKDTDPDEPCPKKRLSSSS